MTAVIRRWVLRNGLELEALDESRDYYGGYWNVRVVVRGEVEVEHLYLEGLLEDPLAEEALKELGEKVQYRRELTKMGVPEGEVGQVKGDLLAYFEENALPYIEHEKFPERLVRRRFEETLKEIRIRRMREELDERDL